MLIPTSSFVRLVCVAKYVISICCLILSICACLVSDALAALLISTVSNDNIGLDISRRICGTSSFWEEDPSDLFIRLFFSDNLAALCEVIALYDGAREARSGKPTPVILGASEVVASRRT